MTQQASFDVTAIRRSAATLAATAQAARLDVEAHLSPTEPAHLDATHLSRAHANARTLRPVLADALGTAVAAQRRLSDELADAASDFAAAEQRAEELAASLEGRAAAVTASASGGVGARCRRPFSRVPDGPFSDDLADDIARLRRAWRDAPTEVRHLFAPHAFLDNLDAMAGEVGPLVADSARIRATEATLMGLADTVEEEAAALSRAWEGYAALVMRAAMKTLAADERSSASNVAGLAAQHEILLARIREQRDVVAGQALRISRTIDQASGAANTGHPAALKLWVFVRGDRAIRDVIELRTAVDAHGEACTDLADFYTTCARTG